MKSAPPTTPSPLAVTLLQADVLSNGSGGFIVRPRKPVHEIPSSEACKMLKVGRATIWALRNHPVAGKILKWRFTTPAQGKLMWETESVLEYIKWTKENLEGK